jgi:hypothetical protein
MAPRAAIVAAWTVGAALLTLLVGQVSGEEAPDLTPLGAERAGNAAGTIPAWTGGLTKAPADYKPGRHETDPFPDDRPLLRIDADNAADYAAHLTAGQHALLAAYPDTWHMNVYPTRRTAAYPPFVYEALQHNATRATLVTDGAGGVEGARVTSPFPQPSTGLEVVWNHNLRWRAIRVVRMEGYAAVTRSGRYGVVLQKQDWGFPYGLPRASAFKERYPNVLLAVRAKIISPALLAGDGTLIWEPINHTATQRKTWLYPRGLRRVIRQPLLGYELPSPNSDGLRTVDDFELYNGAPDRFTWRLLGKREVYIPYNAYRLHSSNVGHRDIVRPGHANPDLARYELHRVWVVEGTLKEGQRHVYGRRVFYVDEDSWQIAVADCWDTSGNLMRVNEAHAVNFYTVPVHWTTLHVYHDLQQERVFFNGLDNEHQPFAFREDGDPREFSPNALNYFLR